MASTLLFLPSSHQLTTLCRYGNNAIFIWWRLWIRIMGLQKHEKLLRALFYKTHKLIIHGNHSIYDNSYNSIIKTVLKLWYHTLRVLFAPDLYLRYMCATILLHIFYEIHCVVRKKWKNIYLQTTNHGRRISKLMKGMENAPTYKERTQIALELDQLLGLHKWREDPNSNIYLYKRVLYKTDMYKKLQNDNDVIGLMFALRAGLLRKHWGIGHPALYNVSHVGTKLAIDEYLTTIVQSMEVVLHATQSSFDCNIEKDALVTDNAEEELSIDNKLAFFVETRHSFGRSALMLSGGGALGFYHSGVVKALVEHNLLPNVIAGSSAGSIVACAIGVRTDDELRSYFEESNDTTFLSSNLTPQDMEEFTPILLKSMQKLLPSGLYTSLQYHAVLVHRYVKKGYVMDSGVLRHALRMSMGDYTFREAYDRTGRIVNVTVTPLKTDDYPHLLNYLTAPNVLMWSASLASCALPMIFQPVELLAKDKHGNIAPYYREGLKWSDGSLECDLPMERLSELFNVNHFIVSQVNIHYKMVSGYSVFGNGQTGSLMRFFKNQMKAYIKNFAEFGLNTKVLKFLDIGLIPLITQKYEGDITICPTESISLTTLLASVLANPATKSDFENIVRAGEQACWPHLSRIRTMCQIEFALERAVRYLRGEQAIEDQKRSSGKKIPRVPSFYTTNSSVNLSGLADTVSPPIIKGVPNSPYNKQSSISSGTASDSEKLIIQGKDHKKSDWSVENETCGPPIRRNRSMNVAGAVIATDNVMDYRDINYRARGHNRSSDVTY